MLRIFLAVLKKLFVLQSSKTLSYFWNIGRILGIIFILQIMTGFFLTFYYSNRSLLAFDRVQYIMYEVNYGWIFRVLHFNGASLFFIVMYLHFFKGLFYFRYRLKGVWFFGLLLILVFIVIAFTGYVLVWAQIRFWASVVITRLITVIPWWGINFLYWLWGGYSVTGVTLKFFFSLHFLIPWFRLILIIAHLLVLHKTGSSSGLFCFGDYDKVNFYPYYLYKDLVNVVYLIFFLVFVFQYPFFFGDSEIFIEANALISPVHIVPEWYFLFVYAILRCIPNKVLGVFGLLFRVLCFFFFLIV